MLHCVGRRVINRAHDPTVRQSRRWSVLPIVQTLLTAVVIVPVVLTAISAFPGNAALVRMLDFPRVQIAMALAGAFLTLLASARHRPRTLVLLGLLAGAALGYQLWRLWPYIAPYRIEGSVAAQCPGADQLSLMVANVQYNNRDAAALLALVRRERPDLLLLLETTAHWDTALAPLETRYPHIVAEPGPDGYGMHLLSRLPLVNPRLSTMFQRERPSLWTGVLMRSGETVRLIGLHPAPPPLSDTARRDAVLVNAGLTARASGEPTIVAGDLNDVPWSQTTRLMTRVGRLADPRVGRGLMPTFNARWPVIRWPLDHVLYTGDFALMTVDVGPDIGSDHFPMLATLCRMRPAARLKAPTPSDLHDAEAIVAAAQGAVDPASAGRR